MESICTEACASGACAERSGCFTRQPPRGSRPCERVLFHRSDARPTSLSLSA